MVILKCQRCRKSYHRRPSHAVGSKFCSRRCHDLGKEYSDGRRRGLRAKARRLRRNDRLMSSEIALRLGISQRTVLTYIKGITLSRRAIRVFLQKKGHEKWEGRELRTNTAIKKRMARTGITKCQVRGCTWRRTLELHHETNGTVKILCPNHHSLTSNWKNKKPKG